MTPLLPLIVSFLLQLQSAVRVVQGITLSGPQAVKLWRIQQRNRLFMTAEATDSRTLPPDVVAGTFTQPLDHFDSKNTATFQQHYWVNPKYYQPGGPVILMDGGEDPGQDLLPYIVDGIGARLASATNGLALMLEHRYYGQSVPVANFSTDSLRWLTNDQAFADSANFMQNVNLSATIGIEGDFTAPNTPYIYYGGSYSGARSAIMKVKYPDLVFGAISSSGVTQATISFWQYADVVRTSTPNCSPAVVKAIETVNQALERPDLNPQLKELFGLGGLADDDFGNTLTTPIGGWQDFNWNAADDNDTWTPFCEQIATKPADTFEQGAMLGDLKIGFELLNYADYIKTQIIPLCRDESIVGCFGTTDASEYEADDLSQTWRPWQFQVCTAWGFFWTVPPTTTTPSLIPKFMFIDCVAGKAFPPGQFFQIPDEPDVNSVIQYGGFNISADRLAIINGELDPWRPATPASQYANLRPREDTILRPFKMIPGATHHWDENGLANISAEPPEIQAIHNEEIVFVKAWLQNFSKPLPDSEEGKSNSGSSTRRSLWLSASEAIWLSLVLGSFLLLR